MVTCGAGIAIVARRGVVYVLAQPVAIAGIVGADVSVIAVLGSTAHTRAVLALVANGTKVTVFARSGPGGKDAARIRRTGVRGARIAVVALQLAAELAPAVQTLVAGGTGIPIVAGDGVVLKGTA